MDYQVTYNHDGRPQNVKFEPNLANSHGEYNGDLANLILKEFGVPGWDWRVPTLSKYCESTNYIQQEIGQAQATVSRLIEDMHYWVALARIYNDYTKAGKGG